MTRVAPSRHVAAKLVLSLCAFVVITSEWTTMGLVADIAETFDRTPAQTGRFITAYALGVIVGTPLLVALGASLPRRELTAALLAWMAAGNLATSFASTHERLCALRFLTAMPAGAILGTCSLMAASLVPPAERGRAVARVFLGLALANLIGSPMTTTIGQQHGWASAYQVVAGLAAVAAVLVLMRVPHTSRHPGANLRSELGALANPRVLRLLAAGMVSTAGVFATYGYIALLVTEVADQPSSLVAWLILVYGIGGLIGNQLAGRLALWDQHRALVIGQALLAVTLVWISLFSPQIVLLAVGGIVLGSITPIVILMLQLNLMRAADGAPLLGAALNNSSLNVANAVGALLGSLIIDTSGSARSAPLAGAVLALIGLAIIVSRLPTRTTLVITTQPERT